MDELQFEYLMTPAAEKLVAKTKKFCLRFFGSDDAALVGDFIDELQKAAQAFGGHKRFREFVDFQAEFFRDFDAAKKFYDEKETARNEN